MYGNVNGSSVGIYASKRKKNADKQLKIENMLNVLGDICSDQVNKGIKDIDTVLPGVKDLLSPVLDSAYYKQQQLGVQLLQETKTSHNGCWNTFLHVDGRTEEYHTENDCAYTYITTPFQDRDNKISDASPPSFLFKITNQVQLMIPLSNNTSFFYNAQFLMHRQSYNPSTDRDRNVFYNLSCYGNDKLFNHLRKSFQRCVHE